MVYFQTKNPNFGYIFEGLGMEKVGSFFGHLEYIKAILNILRPFGNWGYLGQLWYIVSVKIWQPYKQRNKNAKRVSDEMSISKCRF
jgi:hypothetical protein